MAMITGRERVRTTLEHREPDCVLIDFGGTFVTGMHVSSVAALRRHYGLGTNPVKNIAAMIDAVHESNGKRTHV